MTLAVESPRRSLRIPGRGELRRRAADRIAAGVIAAAGLTGSAILLLILGPKHTQGFFVLGQIALWVATIAALVSAVDYWRRFSAAVQSPRPTPVKRSATESKTAGRVSA